MPPAYHEALERLKTVEDRYERFKAEEDRRIIAKAMLELAERAERSPLLQEMLKKTKLRPPFDIFGYVKCYNRKGYWCRSPNNLKYPTIAQAEFRLEASKVSTTLFGIKGVVDCLDGTRIPLRDIIMGDMLRGRKITSDEAKEERERNKTIDRIARTIS